MSALLAIVTTAKLGHSGSSANCANGDMPICVFNTLRSRVQSSFNDWQQA